MASDRVLSLGTTSVVVGCKRRLAPEASSGLLATAGEAFTQAMAAGLVVAAGLAALAAVVVARGLPERESRPEARAGADEVRLAANAQRSA